MRGKLGAGFGVVKAVGDCAFCKYRRLKSIDSAILLQNPIRYLWNTKNDSNLLIISKKTL